MRTIMDRIKFFESSTTGTVEEFNDLFPESKLSFAPGIFVKSIGRILGPETVREIQVGHVTLAHSFVAAQTTAMTNQREQKEQPAPVVVLPFEPKPQKQEEPPKVLILTRNLIMSKKDMGLSPSQYFILQFLRGTTSRTLNKTVIAETLNLSVKTVHNCLNEMSEMGIVTVDEVRGNSQFKIVPTKEWA